MGWGFSGLQELGAGLVAFGSGKVRLDGASDVLTLFVHDEP